ncbi:hypothetical protein J3A83DRAFT_4191173 [Scleroderma citrinum]
MSDANRAPEDPWIRRSGVTWFLVLYAAPTREDVVYQNTALCWDQVDGFYEYDAALRRGEQMVAPQGYMEFWRAYRASWDQRPNSPLDSAVVTKVFPSVGNPNRLEYLDNRRPETEDANVNCVLGQGTGISEDQVDVCKTSSATSAINFVLANALPRGRISNGSPGPLAFEIHLLPPLHIPLTMPTTTAIPTNVESNDLLLITPLSTELEVLVLAEGYMITGGLESTVDNIVVDDENYVDEELEEAKDKGKGKEKVD